MIFVNDLVIDTGYLTIVPDYITQDIAFGYTQDTNMNDLFKVLGMKCYVGSTFFSLWNYDKCLWHYSKKWEFNI